MRTVVIVLLTSRFGGPGSDRVSLEILRPIAYSNDGNQTSSAHIFGGDQPLDLSLSLHEHLQADVIQVRR